MYNQKEEKMDKTYIGLSKKISYCLCYAIPLFGLIFVLKKDEEMETRYVGAQACVIYIIGVILSISEWVVSFIPIISGIVSFVVGGITFFIGVVIIYLIISVIMGKDTKIAFLAPFTKAILDTF